MSVKSTWEAGDRTHETKLAAHTGKCSILMIFEKIRECEQSS